MCSNAIHGNVTSLVIRVFHILTARHKLHELEHVGPFAGTYLPHQDWNHD